MVSSGNFCGTLMHKMQVRLGSLVNFKLFHILHKDLFDCKNAVLLLQFHVIGIDSVGQPICNLNETFIEFEIQSYVLEEVDT